MRRRRRVLHGRVAELLLARPSAWESEPERIAYHWTCAEEPGKALAYWERAGRRALKQAAFLEAAEHFRRRSRRSTRPARRQGDELQRGELLTDWGAALQAGRTPAAGVTRSTPAPGRLVCGRRPRRVVPVVRGEFLFHIARAQYAKALVLADEMLAMGRQSRGLDGARRATSIRRCRTCCGAN